MHPDPWLLPLLSALWAAATPALLLVLAFRLRQMAAAARLVRGLVLALLWLPALAAFVSYEPAVPKSLGLGLFAIGTIAIWVSLHRLIAAMNWRFGWLAHVPLAALGTLMTVGLWLLLWFSDGLIGDHN
jgi:hypothetical protein